MIQVEIVEDIRKFKPKLMLNMTFRQLICVMIAIPLFIIGFFISPWPIGMNHLMKKLIVGAVMAFPLVLCGWVPVGNMDFEKYVIRLIYKNILTPKKRKYVNENHIAKKQLTKNCVSVEQNKKRRGKKSDNNVSYDSEVARFL